MLLRIYVEPAIDPSQLRKLLNHLPLEWRTMPADGAPFETPAVLLIRGDEPSGLPPGVRAIRVGGPYMRDANDAKGLARGLFDILPGLVQGESDELSRRVVDIGIQLSTERDIDALLDLILTQARRLTGSDGASLYLVRGEGDDRHLVFKLAQNESRSMELREMTLPLSRESLTGYVAITGRPLRIDDAYDLPETIPCRINRSFDETHDYRSITMLVIPMVNHQGDVIGVLQLVNRKRHPDRPLSGPAEIPAEVIPYTEEIEAHVTALANMAAVAIENSQLYEAIRNLFDGFVQASVTAIEQRDPTTKGHSLRVSILTAETANVIDRIDSGPLKDISFTMDMIQELRWAALLHDFGKVGVREQVLVKAEKLYPFQKERIEQRFKYLKKLAEIDMLKEKIRLLERGDTLLLDDVESRAAEVSARLDRYLDAILRANLPTVLPEGDFAFLQQIQRFIYETLDGEKVPALEPEEARVLSIRKGSLDDAERLQIESHVTHTYNFLKKIPWTKDLVRIPEITYAHHEKLNGSGYPRGLTSVEIPIQSKIMTVADIFDALSASDRPYKRAVPVDRAIEILHMEANDGMLDPVLVELFTEAELWRKTLHLRQTSS